MFSCLSRPFSHFLVLNSIFWKKIFFYFVRLETRFIINLKCLIQFNYNPHSIIITIFQTESFHFFNWKVSQLKCISLIKLTSNLNNSFPLEKNFFHWEKGWKESRRQCTKSAKKVYRKCTKIKQKGLLLYRYLCLW